MTGEQIGIKQRITLYIQEDSWQSAIRLPSHGDQIYDANEVSYQPLLPGTAESTRVIGRCGVGRIIAMWGMKTDSTSRMR